VVRDLPCNGAKTYDAPDPRGKQGWTAGFGIKCSAGGTKSFGLRYRSRKTRSEHWHTIGSWPVWSVEAARAEARELKRRIDMGGDPLKERREARDAKTMSDLCDAFLAEHVTRKRANTQRDYKGVIENEIQPALGRKLVTAVDHGDVEQLHREISKRAPTRANRVVAVLSRMFTLAMKWRMRPDNPAKGIERNPETKRIRYLDRDELARLPQALAEHPSQQMANAFRLLLLSGARKTELLSARWDQFDLAVGKWVKPGATTKQKTEHEVPLGNEALSLLKSMRKAAPDATFLFSSDGNTGHLVEVKKAWAAICKAAGITNLRPHDLRHSFASILVSSGHSLPVIGSLLGHSQVATTSRYAHLYDDVAREAANKVGSVMAGLVAKPGKGRKLKAIAGGKR
jgi:integrase